MTTHTFKKATIYLNGLFGYRATQVRDLEIETGSEYAQFSNATRVKYIPKGKRKKRGIVETSFPSLVVVEGWKAPMDLASPMEACGDGSSITRRTSCDEGWQTEFDAWIKAKGCEIAFDLRGNDPYANGMTKPGA